MAYLLGVKSKDYFLEKQKEVVKETKPVCLLCLPKDKWSFTISNKKKAK